MNDDDDPGHVSAEESEWVRDRYEITHQPSPTGGPDMTIYTPRPSPRRIAEEDQVVAQRRDYLADIITRNPELRDRTIGGPEIIASIHIEVDADGTITGVNTFAEMLMKRGTDDH
jgi:hypothetical protein